MSTREEIQRAIRSLSIEDLSRFRAWFLAFEAEAWDRQIAGDAVAGRLDRLAREALVDLRTGRTREL